MTTEQMEQILDRALDDDAFLDRLLADPRAAVGEVGAALSDAEVDTVKGMSRDELRAFAAEYKAETDPDKRRAAC
jgi:hypothetical protein